MTYWCCELSDINKFIQEAQPGQKLVYFKGYLYETLLGRSIQSIVYKYATKGLVYLFQKKTVGIVYGYDYIMVKASKKPVITLVPLSDEKIAEQTSTKRMIHYARHQ